MLVIDGAGGLALAVRRVLEPRGASVMRALDEARAVRLVGGIGFRSAPPLWS